MSELIAVYKEEGTCINSEIRKINSFLNFGKTRTLGLKLLNSCLSECSKEDFIEFCVSWMQNCCKFEDTVKANNYGLQVLKKLLKMSVNYPELKKPVSFFITTKYFDYFFKYHLESESGWSCSEFCLMFYRGACNSFQEAIAKHLSFELKKNSKISSTIGRCIALLPCLGLGGSISYLNYKMNWKNQSIMYIHECHSLLNELFVDIEEIQDYDTCKITNDKAINFMNTSLLSVHFYNHCCVLKFMLLNKYPAPKCIPADDFLHLICRGLAVSPEIAEKSSVSGNLKLQKVLPELHASLLSVLNALIVVCGNLLFPYSHLICKLIKQSLEWTNCDHPFSKSIPCELLRISGYETLCNWLTAARNGSGIETVSKDIVHNGLIDIQSKKFATRLKEVPKKKLNSKRQKMHRVDTSTDCTLCCAALTGLQFLVKYSGVFLKLEEHKILQEVVLNLLLEIQKSSPSKIVIPYSASSCRKELYILLLDLISQPCLDRPPPSHLALRIFSRGQNDSCFSVSQFCSSALNFVINIIHSPFDSGNSQIKFQAFARHNESIENLKDIEYREVKNHDSSPTTVNKAIIDDTKPIESDLSVVSVSFEAKPAKQLNDQSEGSDALFGEKSTMTPRHQINDVRNVKFFNSGVEKRATTNEEILNENEPAVKKLKVGEGVSPEMKEKANESVDISAEVVPINEKRLANVEIREVKISKDSSSRQSISPKSPTDDSKPVDQKKRYFLRSKTCKGLAEESEEVRSKCLSSNETFKTPSSVKSTPKDGLTPQSLKRKPKTRASRKLEMAEEERETKSDDDDEDIFKTFHDSCME